MAESLTYSRQSWHYKIILFVFGNQFYYPERAIPTNLCPYLRKLVFSTVFYVPVYMWRKLPNKIQNHSLLGQVLFGYAILVHLAMFIITILAGGEYVTANEIIIEGNVFYDCTIPYDLMSCGTVATSENTNSMSFINDGTELWVSPQYETVRETIPIEWWWGWAFYFISITVAGLGTGLLFGVSVLIDKAKDRPKGKSLGIIGDYMEAKHDNICPCINFTDKKEKEDGKHDKDKKSD